MKKSKFLCSLVLVFFLTKQSKSQVVNGHITDSLKTPFIAECGHNASTVLLGAVSNTNSSSSKLPSSFSASSIINCGKFVLYYDDLLSSSPALGFADPTFGIARRNTLCGVLNYIENTFDLSLVSVANPIRIRVLQSLSSANPSTSSWLAIANPGYVNTSSPQIVNGFIYDYITTGIDPIVSTNFHGTITVNFDQIVPPSNPPYVINWQDDYLAPFVNCKYDLFTTLLHEMGHAMGWFSLTNVTSPTSIGSIIGNNQYTGIDFLVHQGTVFPGPSLNKLILGTVTSPFINPTISTNTVNLTTNDLWVNNLGAPNNYPVYSGQSPGNGGNFALGSVISHLDQQGWVYSLKERISPGATNRIL